MQGPLSLEPGMDSRSLAAAVRGFERSLSDLEAFIMPHCDKLMVRTSTLTTSVALQLLKLPTFRTTTCGQQRVHEWGKTLLATSLRSTRLCMTRGTSMMNHGWLCATSPSRSRPLWRPSEPLQRLKIFRKEREKIVAICSAKSMMTRLLECSVS